MGAEVEADRGSWRSRVEGREESSPEVRLVAPGLLGGWFSLRSACASANLSEVSSVPLLSYACVGELFKRLKS